MDKITVRNDIRVCRASAGHRDPPVPERRGVNFNESSTVDKNLRSHMTHGDQLGPVFQAIVVLLQNLYKHKTVIDKNIGPDVSRGDVKTSMRICLQQVGTLPRSQAADVLDQALSVRVSNSLVHVHPNLVHTVDEFTVKSREQIFFHHVLLREKVRIIKIRKSRTS